MPDYILLLAIKYKKKTKLLFLHFLKKERSKFISSTFEEKHLKEIFTYGTYISQHLNITNYLCMFFTL